MKIQMKLIFVFIISFFLISNSLGSPSDISPYNSVLGFQQGFGFNSKILRPAFDANFVFLFLNSGYSYQKYYGSNGYIGLGIFSLIQIQYGYGFDLDKHMIRIRSDLPFYDILKNKQHSRIFDYFSVGLFYERTFKSVDKDNIIGISLNISIIKSYLDLRDKLGK